MRSEPPFDLISTARMASDRRVRISPAQLTAIRRIVSRTPEVMLKVLNRGAVTARAVSKHVKYISRDGDVNLESEAGEVLRDDYEDHLEDWDLDLDEARPNSTLSAGRRDPPRLVHKIIFSMPAGTPPLNVLASVRDFAREEFALKHRYLLALHTDQPHPHVHMVIKATSEQGHRLYIRKSTLREWRHEFAKHLRHHGVAANASERAVRGSTTPRMHDAIFRILREEQAGRYSWHMAAKIQTAGHVRLMTDPESEKGAKRMRTTRRGVELGWRSTAAVLAQQGEHELAASILKFAQQMPPPLTEQQQIAKQLREKVALR
jgi:relaxase-like protein